MGQGDFLRPVIDRLFVAYTRATGGQTDRHEVRNVNITFPTTRCL